MSSDAAVAHQVFVTLDCDDPAPGSPRSNRRPSGDVFFSTRLGIRSA